MGIQSQEPLHDIQSLTTQWSRTYDLENPGELHVVVDVHGAGLVQHGPHIATVLVQEVVHQLLLVPV